MSNPFLYSSFTRIDDRLSCSDDKTRMIAELHLGLRGCCFDVKYQFSYIWPSDTQVYLEDSTTQETADAEESESVD
ncbi:hypothetical protein VTP01DRAFT_8581 [Rhizomucor pusillus]|uniref:uncharacterized protein n=1 Tax=Rhizomucor pusillus TaxID=4840 RepID=UPI0037429FDF